MLSFNVGKLLPLCAAKHPRRGKVLARYKLRISQLILFAVVIKLYHTESVKREKTRKMQQSDVYYQLLSERVSRIIMPIFRRTKTVCYCIRCTALVLLDVVGCSCGALRCRMRALLTSYNTAPHNRYQPHPAEPAQYTVCSNTRSLLS